MKIKCDGGTVDLDLNEILDSMSERDRISITENAANLVNHVKVNHPLVPFSITSAMEVICKIGMYAVEHPDERIL